MNAVAFSAANENDDIHVELLPEQVQALKIKRCNQNDFNTIVAQCSQCCQSFSSLTGFEPHIRKNHNIKTSESSSNVSKN